MTNNDRVAEEMSTNSTPEVVVAGHVTWDLTDGAHTLGTTACLGGSAAYIARMALNLGLRTGVYTATDGTLGLAESLPGAEIVDLGGGITTTFHNTYELNQGRRQRVLRRATTLQPSTIPAHWLDAPIVILAPVVGELDLSLAAQHRGTLCAAGLQGWLRGIGENGGGGAQGPAAVLSRAELRRIDLIVLSDEDLFPEQAAPMVERLRAWTRFVVYTRGQRGATLYGRHDAWHLDAFPAQPIDPTGAGDVFLAAFSIRLALGRDPLGSARFAAAAASLTVEHSGLDSVPTEQQIEERLAAFPEIRARPVPVQPTS
jgi:hypothetical protein